jgi:hypothetical protein
MHSRRIIVASILALTSALPCFAYNHARRGPTASNLFKHKATKSATRPSGPRAMEPQRATEIQEALIKSGYLSGAPSGHWDADSQAAMQKLQASRGWQTKLAPDSRALILLGLGPQQAKTSAVVETTTDRAFLSVPVAAKPDGYTTALATQ